MGGNLKMRRSFARWLSIVATAMSGSTSFAADLPRIASINLCTDQLLVSLADPPQILGLSPYSRNALLSWAADAAGRFPVLSGGAEDVLVLKPDVVVASLLDKRATRELLKANRLHLAEFAAQKNLDEVKEQIRRMGELVEHADRAAAEIARLDAAVVRARRAVPARHYRVLPLSRRGWVSGSDSLIGSLLVEAGLSNVAGELGIDTGGYASLEAIVNLKPDFLLVSEPGEYAEDNGRALLLHPALDRFYPPGRRMVIPERLTVCGGVMLAEALDVLVAELKRVTQ